MHDLLPRIGEALLMALGMFWKTGWTLVLGFALASLLEATVPSDRMRDALGRPGVRQTALAALFGAASSSCSYASAAIQRTLFKKGAALAPSLAFLIASTNLVLELGIILYLLMGPVFTAAEWVGGVVMIIVMAIVVRATYPTKLVDAARGYEEQGSGHNHQVTAVEGDSWIARVRNPKTPVLVAQNFAMEWSMLWKDLAAGFLIGGFVATFVPSDWWHTLFLTDAPAWVRIPANALIGPVVAMLTFVCSIGNVPLAAVLWGGGASFGGVIAFLYADLIVLPLLDVYRRYYGWRFALYLFAVLFTAIVATGIVIDVGFNALGVVPTTHGDIRAAMTDFKIDYTFWLNLVALAGAGWLFITNRRNPMQHEHHC